MTWNLSSGLEPEVFPSSSISATDSETVTFLSQREAWVSEWVSERASKRCWLTHLPLRPGFNFSWSSSLWCSCLLFSWNCASPSQMYFLLCPPNSTTWILVKHLFLLFKPVRSSAACSHLSSFCNQVNIRETCCFSHREQVLNELFMGFHYWKFFKM